MFVYMIGELENEEEKRRTCCFGCQDNLMPYASMTTSPQNLQRCVVKWSNDDLSFAQNLGSVHIYFFIKSHVKNLSQVCNSQVRPFQASFLHASKRSRFNCRNSEMIHCTGRADSKTLSEWTSGHQSWLAPKILHFAEAIDCHLFLGIFLNLVLMYKL